MRPNGAWIRAFLSTIAKGAAEGYIAAAGGNGALTTFHQPGVSLTAMALFMASNAAWDIACFVRANPDFTLPPAQITLPVQTKPESPVPSSS